MKPLPASLSAGCDSPVPIPQAPLAAGGVISLWGRDRAALAKCRDRHAATVSAYRILGEKLAAADRR